MPGPVGEPFTAAAIATTLFAAVDVMLFRRVTRCAGLIEPTDREWEWIRDWREGKLEAVELEDGRCWLDGRGGCMSWNRQGQRAASSSAGQRTTFETVIVADSVRWLSNLEAL